MRAIGKTYAVFLLVILAAGCQGNSQGADSEKPPAGYDPRGTTVPAAPQPIVKITSLADGDWNVDTNPILAWTASKDLGEIQFASVEIFENSSGEPARVDPDITIDDTAGELARNNGGRLFDKLDGVLISFHDERTDADKLKPATRYLLVLKLIGARGEGTARVKFSTR
jgi:hypothetical protein